MKELTHKEIAIMGGRARWANIKPKQRSALMKKVRKGGKPTKVEWYKGGQIFKRAVGKRG